MEVKQPDLFAELPAPGNPEDPPESTESKGPAAPAPEPVPYTWTEQYRHECEIRAIADMDPVARREHLVRVKARRPPAQWLRIRVDVLAELDRRRKAAA